MSGYVYRYTLQLNAEADRDVIDWLEQQPNKARSIRDALRGAIDRDDVDGGE
jgi:hypothetical protein